MTELGSLFGSLGPVGIGLGILFFVGNLVYDKFKERKTDKTNEPRVAIENDGLLITATKEVVNMIRGELNESVKQLAAERAEAEVSRAQIVLLKKDVSDGLAREDLKDKEIDRLRGLVGGTITVSVPDDHDAPGIATIPGPALPPGATPAELEVITTTPESEAS